MFFFSFVNFLRTSWLQNNFGGMLSFVVQHILVHLQSTEFVNLIIFLNLIIVIKNGKIVGKHGPYLAEF